MEELIKALQIFSKYVEGYNKDYPTHCEHDELQIVHEHPENEKL